MSRTDQAEKPLQDHPLALIELYVFTCDAVDTAVRIRCLKGSRVRADAVMRAACRIVYHGSKSLFRSTYEGFPEPKDDRTLMLMLMLDEREHPDDYTAESAILKTVRGVRPRQEDMLLDIDFVDPQVGYAPGNILLVGRRSLRLRDRASLDELDAIAAYYHAQKAIDPTLKMEFVDQGRWPLIP